MSRQLRYNMELERLTVLETTLTCDWLQLHDMKYIIVCPSCSTI